MALGIAQLALYDEKDDEQRLNVELLKTQKLGSGAPFSEGEQELQSFLEHLESSSTTLADPWKDAPQSADAANTVGDALSMIVSAGRDWKRSLDWSKRQE